MLTPYTGRPYIIFGFAVAGIQKVIHFRLWISSSSKTSDDKKAFVFLI